MRDMYSLWKAKEINPEANAAWWDAIAGGGRILKIASYPQKPAVGV
jgi:ABC-type tungstate transport system permease subunit